MRKEKGFKLDIDRCDLIKIDEKCSSFVKNEESIWLTWSRWLVRGVRVDWSYRGCSPRLLLWRIRGLRGRRTIGSSRTPTHYHPLHINSNSRLKKEKKLSVKKIINKHHLKNRRNSKLQQSIYHASLNLPNHFLSYLQDNRKIVFTFWQFKLPIGILTNNKFEFFSFHIYPLVGKNSLMRVSCIVLGIENWSDEVCLWLFDKWNNGCHRFTIVYFVFATNFSCKVLKKRILRFKTKMIDDNKSQMINIH